MVEDIDQVADAHNLSLQRTALIGRTRELAEIREILSKLDARLVTLTGVGGTGKTRLALRLAAELAPTFPRRSWVVELASISRAELLPLVVATGIGLRDFNETDLMTAVVVFLSSQPALLVLDNCEHLIDACANLVDALLSGCPDLRIIATSREPLLVQGEHQYRVPPLDLASFGESATDVIAAAPAVELFVARAQNILPSFRLTASNAESVARICTRLGGIPLALELAAARVGVLGVDQIVARLDDTFRLLTGGSRVAPTRHQTLRAALDWSDALLTGDERAVFRRLAVFAGEFQLTAAEAVCASADRSTIDVLDALTGLTNKSLVTATSDEREAWYHLLEPVRQYALEQLESSGEAAATQQSHTRFYLDFAERAAVEVRGPDQVAWLERLEREQSNFRVALERAFDHGDAESSLRLAAGLVRFWEFHGHLAEGLRWVRQALSLPSDSVDPNLRMRVLNGAGRLVYLFEDGRGVHCSEAQALLEESLTLAMSTGDQRRIADALTELGMVYRMQRDLPRSVTVLTEALNRYRELGDEFGVMFTMLNLASTVLVQGDLARGLPLLTESMERSRALGGLRHTAIAQVGLGRTVQAEGAFGQAIELILEAMSTHLRLGDRWFVIFDLFSLADVLIDADFPRQGIQLMSSAESLSKQLGTPVGGLSFAGLRAKVESLRREDWFEAAWAEGQALEPPDAMGNARQLLDQLRRGERLAPPAGAPTLAPLTRREREVARLLAEGLTDRQIADTLYLSIGTVGVHVHHILQKLELRSRIEVAAWLKAQQRADPDTP